MPKGKKKESRKPKKSKKPKKGGKKKEPVSKAPSLAREVGTGVRSGGARTRPTGMGTETRYSFRSTGIPRGRRISGHEFLTPVTLTTATNTIGGILEQVDLNPTTWVGTRVCTEAYMYQKFKVRKLELHFISNVSPNNNGQIHAGFSKDIAQPLPPANLEGIREISGWEGNKGFPVYAEAWVPMPDWGKTEYFLNEADVTAGVSDQRLNYPGYALLMLENMVANTGGNSETLNGLVLGSVYLNYDIELYDAFNNSDNQQLEVYATANNFTTSPSTGGSAGWDLLTTSNTTSIGSISETQITIGPNSGAHTSFLLGEGLYEVEQYWTATDSAGSHNNLWNDVNVVAVDSAQTGNIQQMNINYPGAATTTAAGGLVTCYLRTAISVPIGGAWFYGSWAGSSAYTCTTGGLRIVIRRCDPALAQAVGVSPPSKIRQIARKWKAHGHAFPGPFHGPIPDMPAPVRTPSVSEEKEALELKLLRLQISQITESPFAPGRAELNKELRRTRESLLKQRPAWSEEVIPVPESLEESDDEAPAPPPEPVRIPVSSLTVPSKKQRIP